MSYAGCNGCEQDCCESCRPRVVSRKLAVYFGCVDRGGGATGSTVGVGHGRPNRGAEDMNEPRKEAAS